MHVELSRDVQPRCSKLGKKVMHQLAISFGAFDLIEAESGEIYFLEVNPHGQFLFNEADPGTPMECLHGRFLADGNVARATREVSALEPSSYVGVTPVRGGYDQSSCGAWVCESARCG